VSSIFADLPPGLASMLRAATLRRSVDAMTAQQPRHRISVRLLTSASARSLQMAAVQQD
jgi:hypothetical protein